MSFRGDFNLPIFVVKRAKIRVWTNLGLKAWRGLLTSRLISSNMQSDCIMDDVGVADVYSTRFGAVHQTIKEIPQPIVNVQPPEVINMPSR